jgi:flagellar protein FlbD
LIKVTDVSQKEKFINCDLIEKIEMVPDTLVTLINGHSFMVRDNPDDIIQRIIEYKRRCHETIHNSAMMTVTDKMAEEESIDSE